ncbi:MAG: hypothetical protein JRC99_10180 [Deltaproteobacteria bacterium]|nr:hypothetical protein [Deltaproteobacteria bacterium]
MSTNQATTISLFPDFSFCTKKENRERILKDLGFLNPVGLQVQTTVQIERLIDNDYDLFSFDFSSEEVTSVSPPTRKVWTALEVAIAHEQLIINLLEDIRDKRVCNRTLVDWLCWVEGKEDLIGKPLPFSFEACCLFWNFEPDEFRHRISYVLRHHRGWNIRWNERKVLR